MYARLLEPPEHSLLLLGPRGTGKSTWIAQRFPGVPTYDLLDTAEALRLSKHPSLLYREGAALAAGSWLVIDEVQKVPALLDEAQRLIERCRLRLVLSGSSARKLRRGSANLLAGRAALTEMHPLVSAEVGFVLRIPDVFRFGMLPAAYTAADPLPYLRTYAQVYLREEVQGEALTRNIGPFARFLEIAARQNAQVTSAAGIARDAQVSRQTVQGYFDILVDTLLGSWLPPWKLKRATKQVGHPKFYFFDAGVARALSGRLPYPPTPEELGPLFETFLLGEVRAFLSYRRLHYPLAFWRTYDGVEVDLLFETARGYLAIEMKSSDRWEPRFNRGLRRVRDDLGAGRVRCLGVYAGEREARFDDVRVLPVVQFLRELWAGDLT
jgi:predicted AAA+ superfamily ATPase